MKKLIWIGSSRKDLYELPTSVKQTFGYALHLAQSGAKHPNAKSLQGFGSGGVIEVVESSTQGTFRAVYTVSFHDVVYVLHCFQKKSKRGIATPKSDIDLIRNRLKEAEKLSRGN